MTKETSKGMLGDIVDSIFTPGTNSSLINAMNYSFYGLFLTLLGMLYLTSANIHICAMLTLSIGLFISIKWFLLAIADVEELHKIERLAKEAAESKEAEQEKTPVITTQEEKKSQ